MPTYPYQCDTCENPFEVVKRMASSSRAETCPRCHTPEARRVYTPVGITGQEWVGGKHSKQLGVTFGSAAEVDAYCEKEGLEPVATNSKAWQQGVIQRSKNNGDKEAKSEGWTDSEERKTSLKENARDHVAVTRQEHIDAYHDEHGSEGKRNVDDADIFHDELPT